MTIPTQEEIAIAAAEGRLLDIIFKDRWRHDTDAYSQVLISAHQAKEINLRALLPLPEAPAYSNHELYLGLGILVPALGAIALNCEDLLELMAGAVHQEDPMLNHLVFTESMKWCQAEFHRPVELLHLIESGAPLARRFHCLQVCISAGLSVDPTLFTTKGIEFLQIGDAQERAQAARAFCNLSSGTLGTNVDLSNAVSSVIEREAEPSVRDALLAMAIAWLKDASADSQLSVLKLVERAAAPIRLEAKRAVGQALLAGADAYSLQVRNDLLTLVASGQPEDEIVNLLDIVLSQFIKFGDVVLARGVVERLIATDPGVPFDHFDSVVHELESGDDSRLSEWVVSWLRSGSLALCLSLRSGLLQGSEERMFAFDFARMPDLLESDYPFIARKAIGTFLAKPLFAASLVVCMMRSATGATLRALENLLFDPILINYSGLGSDYLNEIAENPADLASQAVQRVMAALRGYLDGLGDAHIRELQPSERQRQLEHDLRNEKMQNDMAEARKRSIFSSLVNEKVLLYGTGMACWIAEFPQAQNDANDQVAPMRRMEQSLATVQHTFHLPRQSVLDPTTLELTIFTFLLEPRSQ
ncbi:hypothetical protein [Pseudomonas sp. Z3-8]|uniref:hypothetical protein n=1 Tax=Pseudomonas sp. Z3-8 TaxID=2817412 RepID=UPI003DA8A107